MRPSATCRKRDLAKQINGRTTTEEDEGGEYMSTTDNTKGYKTLAIRLNDDVHAQLQVIAKLLDSSIAEEIRSLSACKFSI